MNSPFPRIDTKVSLMSGISVARSRVAYIARTRTDLAPVCEHSFTRYCSDRTGKTREHRSRRRGEYSIEALELKSGGSTDTTQNIGTFSRRVGRHIFQKNPTYSKKYKHCK